jgi:hypothetical protein
MIWRPTTCFTRPIAVGIRTTKVSEIRSPIPVLTKATPDSRRLTSPGLSPAHATRVIAPIEWPPATTRCFFGTQASSTAWKSAASASIE